MSGRSPDSAGLIPDEADGRPQDPEVPKVSTAAGKNAAGTDTGLLDLIAGLDSSA